MTGPKTDAERFTEAMTAAGFEVIHYDGASFWHGPAVVYDTVEEQRRIEAATPVPLLAATYGYQYVYYPVEGEPGAYRHMLEMNPHLQHDPFPDEPTPAGD